MLDYVPGAFTALVIAANERKKRLGDRSPVTMADVRFENDHVHPEDMIDFMKAVELTDEEVTK